MPFEASPASIDGLVILKPRCFGDDRGWFMESYKKSAFADLGLAEPFVQDNLSLSSHGTLRGLHYQVVPHAQGKLVTVVTGAVYDVAVDLRPGSKTLGQWFGITITESDPCLFFIPPGFAHGFCALSDDTRFLYKCTAEYHKESERGIRYDDPDLRIEWPVAKPIVSKKDSAMPSLSEVLKEVTL